MAADQQHQDTASALATMAGGLSRVEEGLGKVYEALERLASLETSRKHTEENIQTLFALHESAQKDSRDRLESLRDHCDAKFDAQATKISTVENAVTQLGGNLNSHTGLTKWLANNGANLVITLAGAGFAAWLAVHWAGQHVPEPANSPAVTHSVQGS